jgi:hypothetical protein
LLDTVWLGERRLCRWQHLGVSRAAEIARQNSLDLYLTTAAVDQPQFVGGGVGKIDDAVGVKRAAVNDADDDRFAGLQLSNANVRRQGERRVGCGHGKHVVRLANRCFLAVEFLAIPTGHATRFVGFERGIRHIGFAENVVRFGGRFV